MRYPVQFGLEALLDHQLVDAAKRLEGTGKCPTQQVVVTVRGPPVPSLDLGPWGVYKTRSYVPDPRRCFRCQKYRHMRAVCHSPPKCGVCSGPHETEKCITAHKASDRVDPPAKARCPNCKKGHHAWNQRCVVRRREATKIRSVFENRVDFIAGPRKPSDGKGGTPIPVSSERSRGGKTLSSESRHRPTKSDQSKSGPSKPPRVEAPDDFPPLQG